MGLAPGQIIADVESMVESIEIARSALDRATDRLALLRQDALDIMSI